MKTYFYNNFKKDWFFYYVISISLGFLINLIGLLSLESFIFGNFILGLAGIVIGSIIFLIIPMSIRKKNLLKNDSFKTSFVLQTLGILLTISSVFVNILSISSLVQYTENNEAINSSKGASEGPENLEVVLLCEYIVVTSQPTLKVSIDLTSEIDINGVSLTIIPEPNNFEDYFDIDRRLGSDAMKTFNKVSYYEINKNTSYVVNLYVTSHSPGKLVDSCSI